MNMQKNSRSQSNQSANIQLQALLSEVSNVLKKIDETISDSVAQLNEINSRVNESIAKVEKIFSELDQIEKDAGDEMDKLILQQAEALAEE
jgi:ElaB/YqjD/DUF883 family membrane-anchored ribosome-binding protein